MTSTGFIVVGKGANGDYGFKKLEYGAAVPDKHGGELIELFSVATDGTVVLQMANDAQVFETTANVTFENGYTMALPWGTKEYGAKDLAGAAIIRNHHDGVLNYVIEGITFSEADKEDEPKPKKRGRPKKEKDE